MSVPHPGQSEPRQVVWASAPLKRTLIDSNIQQKTAASGSCAAIARAPPLFSANLAHALITQEVRGRRVRSPSPMASSSAATAVPRLANKIRLDPQLDEQRQREHEALVRLLESYLPGFMRSHDSLVHTSIYTFRRKSSSGCLSTSTHRKWTQLINAYRCTQS